MTRHRGQWDQDSRRDQTEQGRAAQQVASQARVERYRVLTRVHGLPRKAALRRMGLRSESTATRYEAILAAREHAS